MEALREAIKQAVKGAFYRKRFAGIRPGDINSLDDFRKLPFTDKDDLRNAYPLGLQAVPDERIVRIHSSSGTTGMPVIIPYTQEDINDWTLMFARCYVTAGVTNLDRIQITPGYGMWTAGIGFQTGAEALGAMTIPMGPGNTDKQIHMMLDLQSTVLCATSSYALLLAEEIKKRGVGDKIRLQKGIIGSERWGAKMRRRIQTELNIRLYDIYGLTEIYGPGIGISCDRQNGMHLWTDYLHIEIIDPQTGAPLPDGETGELVITTLKKQGAPLIRYRTHDLTRIIPGECGCGLSYPRIDTITGRSDDMFKVKGAIIYPARVDELLAQIDGVCSEYQIHIEHVNNKDVLTLLFESSLPEGDFAHLEHTVKASFKEKIGIAPKVKAVPRGELPRSERKSVRVFDNRDKE
jgi:phenylacetate-CoA ligase